MINGSVLQSAQRCFEKKSRVVVKMVEILHFKCFFTKVHPNLVPRVFSLFNMAAAREKTLAHSRSRVSNEDGDVFKMAATAKRVRRTGYEMLR